MRTKIIFEDRDILVIQKPAGLATQTARVDQQDVVSELKNYLTGSSYLGIVHRLDQPVEGLLVFGKTKSAAAFLTAQLGQLSHVTEILPKINSGSPKERSSSLM